MITIQSLRAFVKLLLPTAEVDLQGAAARSAGLRRLPQSDPWPLCVGWAARHFALGGI